MISWLFLAAAASQPSPIACPEKAPQDLVTVKVGNGPLVATIAPSLGGQLVGLSFTRDGKAEELLYRGMNFCGEPGWDGKAPVLWPATGPNFVDDGTGALKQGWNWQGRYYPLPNHGFARDMPWTLVKQGFGFVEVGLTDTPETRKVYPFGFHLSIKYVLKGTILTLHHRVVAAKDNADAMPFSIGNHITFNIPKVAKGASGGAVLDSPAATEIILDEKRRPQSERASGPITAIPVAELLKAKSVAYGGYSPAQVWARTRFPDGKVIRVSHRTKQWPAGTPVQFNFWGDTAQGYFAPEPWAGKQNSLASGDGVIRLAPGKSYDWTVEIRVD